MREYETDYTGTTGVTEPGDIPEEWYERLSRASGLDDLGDAPMPNGPAPSPAIEAMIERAERYVSPLCPVCGVPMAEHAEEGHGRSW